MPSSKKQRPTAPTRPAETTCDTDRFEKLVHHEGENLFYTLDKSKYPNGLDWVLVELHDGKKAVELYDGQNFVAVITILEFYKLQNGSEQRRETQTRRGFASWLFLFVLPLTELLKLVGAFAP